MFKIFKTNEIKTVDELQEILHSCSLDAWSYPVGEGNSRYLDRWAWDDFRKEVATQLFKRLRMTRR